MLALCPHQIVFSPKTASRPEQTAISALHKVPNPPQAQRCHFRIPKRDHITARSTRRAQSSHHLTFAGVGVGGCGRSIYVARASRRVRSAERSSCRVAAAAGRRALEGVRAERSVWLRGVVWCPVCGSRLKVHTQKRKFQTLFRQQKVVRGEITLVPVPLPRRRAANSAPDGLPGVCFFAGCDYLDV